MELKLQRAGRKYGWVEHTRLLNGFCINATKR